MIKLRGFDEFIKIFIKLFLIFFGIYFSTELKTDALKEQTLFDTFINFQYKRNKNLRLFIADEPLEKRLGLMNIKKLGSNDGMIFVFNPPKNVKFWMKNTLIPLDMIFIRNNQIIEILENVMPCTKNICELFGPDEIVDFVIEINSGKTKEIGLKKGDYIEIKL